jgi:hypothetical protein
MLGDPLPIPVFLFSSVTGKRQVNPSSLALFAFAVSEIRFRACQYGFSKDNGARIVIPTGSRVSNRASITLVARQT